MESRNQVERLAVDLYRYVEMRIDSAKLSAAEHLSTLSAAIISLLIAALFMTLSLLFFTLLATYAIYVWIGSPFWAIAIMGSLLTSFALLFWATRKSMFVDSMVRLFCRMVFAEHQHIKEKN